MKTRTILLILAFCAAVFVSIVCFAVSINPLTAQPKAISPRVAGMQQNAAMVAPPATAYYTSGIAYYSGIKIMSGTSGVAAYANGTILTSTSPLGPWKWATNFPMCGQQVTNIFVSTNRALFYRQQWLSF